MIPRMTTLNMIAILVTLPGTFMNQATYPEPLASDATGESQWKPASREIARKPVADRLTIQPYSDLEDLAGPPALL